MKQIECPKCLGEGKYYNSLNDDVVDCNLCKGIGIVLEKTAELYDPMADELTNTLFDEEKE